MTIGPMILLILVISAAWIDSRTFRIPNRLVLAGIGIGFVLSAMLPDGNAVSSVTHSSIGVLNALAGAGVGFGILFPIYLTGAMGAGDVKLMAMIGVFLGPNPTLIVILFSFIFGGVLSLVIAIRNKTLRLMLANIYDAMLGLALSLPGTGIGKVNLPRQSAGRMPYALAIAGGVSVYFLLGREVAQALN